MMKPIVQGLAGQILAQRKALYPGYQSEYHNGVAVRVPGGPYEEVSLRRGRESDFVPIRDCFSGFSPQEDGDPVDVYKGGTRQLIHPDGTIDILYGRFQTYPSWPGGKEWVTQFAFFGTDPGKLPAGLVETPDGESLVLPEGTGYPTLIPLPIKASFFEMPEPLNIEMQEMVESIRGQMPPLPPKLDPLMSYGPPLDD